MSVALRLGWATHPGAPFWQTPCAHLWEAWEVHAERTEAERQDAWHREVFAACVVGNRIPVFEKADPLTPEAFLPWLRSAPTLSEAERLRIATAKVEAADERQRLAANASP